MSQDAYTPPTSSIEGQSPYSTGSDTVSPGIIHHLSRSRPWILLIAIVLLLVAIITIIAGAGIILGGAAMDQAFQGLPLGEFGGMIIGLLYIFMGAAFYLLPCIFLFRYAAAINDAKRSHSVGDTENAISKQATFWKVIGIFTLIGIALFVLFFVFAIVAAISGAMP